jgi:sec-independent protein translocase protein TatC
MKVIPERLRRRKDGSGTMTVFEHLDELRTRLIVAVLSVLIGSILGWFLFGPAVHILTKPFCTFMTSHPQLAARPADPCRLVYGGPLEPFVTKLKVTVFLGFALSLPVVLYEFWRFVTPGLMPNERKLALPFVLTSIVLFLFGAWFALFTLPKAMAFLLGFAGTSRVLLLMTYGKYLGFVTLTILAFGVSFEFPLVLISLTLVGVLSSQKLRAWRRYAILAIAVFAAVITPSQDWFTMTAMMVPLVVFYELSILVSRLLKH